MLTGSKVMEGERDVPTSWEHSEHIPDRPGGDFRRSLPLPSFGIAWIRP